LRHFVDVFLLPVCHVAKIGKHHESREYAGKTVDCRRKQTVAEKREKLLTAAMKRHSLKHKKEKFSGLPLAMTMATVVKDARSVSLYPYNPSQILQYV